jgi:hypothetical protein
MFSDTRAALRGLGALGATVAVIATFLPWYVFDVVLPLGGVTHRFAVAATLWDVTTLAPVLIVVGAAVALVCLSIVGARWAGPVEALIGLGITAYALVRCFDIPNLGVAGLRGGPGGTAGAGTELGGGTLLAVSGGIMLLLGSLGDLLPSPEADGATGEQARDARFERTAAAEPPGRVTP